MVTAVTQSVGNCSGPGFQRAVLESLRYLVGRMDAPKSACRGLNLRSQIDRCTDTPYRDSKGRLSAFGRVSFVTFLWRNKEKFIIRSNTCVCHCCLSPTGECVLKLNPYINLSRKQKTLCTQMQSVCCLNYQGMMLSLTPPRKSPRPLEKSPTVLVMPSTSPLS